MRTPQINLSGVLAALLLLGLTAMAFAPFALPLVRTIFVSATASDAIEVEDTRAWEQDAVGYQSTPR